MPSVVNRHLNGFSDMEAAIQGLQAYLGRPVTTSMDPQSFGPEIIKLQTFLSTQAAAGQPSGFKFDPAQISKAVVDHSVPRMIIQLQQAADLT